MSQMTALVVDDDPVLLALATHILSQEGFSTRSEQSAEGALVAAENEPISLLFSDVVLPGLSGLDLAATLREQWPDLPVLLTTGHRSPELWDEIVRSGLPAIRKPYRAPDVISWLNKAFDRSAESRTCHGASPGG